MKIRIYKNDTFGKYSACAEVEVRLTPKQVVVLSGEIVERIKPNTFPKFYNNGYPTGPLKFWRENGRAVGAHWRVPSWQISKEELDKISCLNPVDFDQKYENLPAN